MIRTNQQVLQFIDHYHRQPEAAGKVRLLSLAPGQRLISQGQQLRQVFVIGEGISKCFITGENSKDYIVEFLGPGEVIGEVEVIRRTASLTNVEALTPLQVYCITSECFEGLLRNEREFNGLILEVMAARMCNTAHRAATQQLFPVEYALLRLLQLLEDQQLDFSKQDLADYLAVSLRSFNRIVRDLREKGVLAGDSMALQHDPARIAALLRSFED